MIEYNEFEKKALILYKTEYYPIEFYMRNLFIETFNVKIDPSKISMLKNIVIFNFDSFEIWGLTNMRFYFKINGKYIPKSEVKTIQDVGRFIFKYVEGEFI